MRAERLERLERPVRLGRLDWAGRSRLTLRRTGPETRALTRSPHAHRDLDRPPCPGPGPNHPDRPARAPPSRPARPPRPAAAGQCPADRAGPPAPATGGLGAAVRAGLPGALRPLAHAGGQRPPGGGGDDARPARWFQAHRAAAASRPGDGAQARCLRRQRRGVETPAPHGDARLRPDPCSTLLPGLARRGAAAGRTLAARRSGWAGHRSAGRPDALHRRHHRRAGLRRRSQHAGVGPRRDSAAPGQDLPDTVAAPRVAVSGLALVQVEVRPAARAEHGGGERRSRRFCRPGAGTPAGRPDAARAATQPAGGHAGEG